MAVFDENSKLWRSSIDQQSYDDIKLSPGQRILDAFTAHGSKVAQIIDETGVRMTYNEIRLKTVRAAQNLLKRGFKPRDVFGFLAGSSEHLVPLMVASICLACPVAPLYSMLTKDEIVRFFLKTKPTVVFCDVSAYDQLAEALLELPFSVQVFTLGGKMNGAEPVENLFVETGEENDFVPTMVDIESDIGLITCSSGTTGPSKYLFRPYDVPMFMSPDIYDPNHIVYCSDDIFWTIGSKHTLDCIHSGATRVITTATYTPQTPLQMIAKYKVTKLPIAAFDLIACLKTALIRTVDLSSVREIYVYGGHLPDNLIDRINQYFPDARIIAWYGSTELGMIAYRFPQDADGSSGTFIDGFTIKIVDNDGKRCGPNESGELCLKKEHTFRGYLDDPVATAAALDDEGFFLTGDVACIDDSGRLSIKDRAKNILKLFYFDSVLFPLELEECLINMPGVEEVCVVGVPITGGATLPAAMVVPKPNSKLSKRDVFDRIAEHFPHRSWLRAGVYFINSFPKTSNGKLVRREITKTAIEMFDAAKQNDPELQSYLSDIPFEFRELI